MIDVAKTLPEDPDELRAFTQLLLAEFKSQALLITKLNHYRLASVGLRMCCSRY